MPRELHGLSGTPEHRSWKAMKTRCLNPNGPRWKHYGGRGITICQEWIDSFTAFLAHVGPRPPKHTLDRIDNEKGYEPGNVQWANQTVQTRNSRHIHPITFEGRTLSISEWAEIKGFPYSCLLSRAHKGWSPERMLTEPLGFFDTQPRPKRVRPTKPETAPHFRGVTWSKEKGKWHVQVKAHGVNHYVGYFRDQLSAATAYNFKAFELHGDQARYNEPLVATA